jgi:hypothetical protein
MHGPHNVKFIHTFTSSFYPMDLVMGSEALSRQQSSQPSRKADRSPPSSAVVKSAWSCDSTAPNSYVALLNVKNSDEFIFLLAHIVGFVHTFK